jgi:hypothetical protein
MDPPRNHSKLFEKVKSNFRWRELADMHWGFKLRRGDDPENSVETPHRQNTPNGHFRSLPPDLAGGRGLSAG